MQISDVLNNTDWEDLARQKAELVQAIEDFRVNSPEEWSHSYAGRIEMLTGLLHWVDNLQDAAEADGLPVIFLTVPEEGDPGYDPAREGQVQLISADGVIIGDGAGA